MLITDQLFPRLTTERMILRQLEATDAAEIYLLRSDEKVNQFIERPRANSIEDALNFIHNIRTGISNKEWFFWAIVPKGEKKLCGTICLWNLDKKNNKVEIGFELLPAFHCKGIMHEAVAATIDFAFSVMKVNTIEAFTHQQNLASLKVLVKHNFTRDHKAEMNREKKEAHMVIYSLHATQKNI
ncbi:MAG TPA: GNAT family N-acetyltransferase [Chitinophagaceae bacterium]